tara:strand:+ start:134 stop:352 length:219 start_codon:yes stop_codon:yes gene_type:complete
MSNPIAKKISEFHFDLPKENIQVHELKQIQNHLFVLKKSFDEYQLLIQNIYEQKLSEYNQRTENAKIKKESH